MKPRLLFVSNLFPDAREVYRGLDNVTLLHHLADRWDIRVICPRPALKAWLGKQEPLTARAGDEPFAPQYLSVPYVPKMGSRWNHRLMAAPLGRAMERLRRDWSWDVVLGAWLYPDGCALVRATEGKRTFLIAQGSDVHKYLKVPARRAAIIKAAGRTDGVFTRSRSLAVSLGQAGVGGERLHPIHNGVDTTCFTQRDKRAARQELGLGAEDKVLLFVGNLLPVKDPHLLLKTFASLTSQPEGEAWRLAIIGKGPLRAELEQAAAQAGLAQRVTFLGPRLAREVAQWMNAADALCLTSHNEGLPNVVLEAMACGLPVVATDVGGISEVIDASWNGALCPVREPSALATLVTQTLALAEPERIAKEGARRNWKAVADAYHAVMTTVPN